MSHALDWAELGTRRQAIDDGVGSDQQRAAGKKGGKVTAARRRAMLRRINTFPFKLANAVMAEPRRRGATPGEHVQALADQHHAALSRTLKRWKIPHARGVSPLVTVPFLLAGFYLARMLHEFTRTGARSRAFSRIRYDGQKALEERWGSGGFGYELFPTSARDRNAWWGNCGLAGDWIEQLMHLPDEYLTLVRKCENPRCRTGFFWARGAREASTCSDACRVALLRARGRGTAPRRDVTIQRSKRKVSGVPASNSPRQSPVVSRPAVH